MEQGFLPRLWLRRVPLFHRILLANAAVVAVGAIAGTTITFWAARRLPVDIHYQLIALFAGAGILLSFVLNRWVLRRAVAPLDRLQSAVDEVRRGRRSVRVELDPSDDERFARLGETFNLMLDRQEENAVQLRGLSQQLLQAQEEERRRLARELHDEAAQALTSLLVRLRLLERAHNPEEAQIRVHELRELTAQALEEVRRVALDLRPTILDDLGLGPALEWRVDEFNRSGEVQATAEIAAPDRRLPRDIELALYRVGQEALSNVARHADARQVTVRLAAQPEELVLTIADDGRGLSPAPQERPSGLGLVGMRERMAMVGGRLDIQSAPGRGVTVRATVPLAGVEPTAASPAGPTTPGSVQTNENR